MLTVLLGGCAANPAQTELSRKNVRANALQGWNRCLNGHLRDGSDSGQSLSIPESMDSCQGYRYDFISTYPRHLSGSIDKLLTDAAYRSGFSTLSKKSEPEIGRMAKHQYGKALDALINQTTQ